MAVKRVSVWSSLRLPSLLRSLTTLVTGSLVQPCDPGTRGLPVASDRNGLTSDRLSRPDAQNKGRSRGETWLTTVPGHCGSSCCPYRDVTGHHYGNLVGIPRESTDVANLTALDHP